MGNLEPLESQESIETLDEERLEAVTGGGACCTVPRTLETTNPIVRRGRLPTGETVTIHQSGAYVIHAPGVTNFSVPAALPRGLWERTANDAPLTLVHRRSNTSDASTSSNT